MDGLEERDVLDRLKELFGFGGTDEEEDHMISDMEERGGRVSGGPSQALVVIVRGRMGQERKEELAELIRAGKMVLLDLRGMEKEPGQSLLDFMSGVSFACRGVVVRVAGGLFMAAPRKEMIEEWEEEDRG